MTASLVLPLSHMGSYSLQDNKLLVIDFCSDPSYTSASPRRPASEAQSPPELGAGGPAEPPHAPAASARPEGTTDPSLRIRPSTVCNCRSSMRHPLLRHW